MATGTVKWFDAAKGFGFITPDDGTADVFLPINKVEEAKIAHPEQGTYVSYELSERNGKRYAGKLAILPPKPVPLFKPMRRDDRELDAEELFEREWGLRRAN